MCTGAFLRSSSSLVLHVGAVSSKLTESPRTSVIYLGEFKEFSIFGTSSRKSTHRPSFLYKSIRLLYVCASMKRIANKLLSFRLLDDFVLINDN